MTLSAALSSQETASYLESIPEEGNKRKALLRYYELSMDAEHSEQGTGGSTRFKQGRRGGHENQSRFPFLVRKERIHVDV